MNEKFKKIIPIAYCLASATIFGCAKSPDSEYLGSIKLTSTGTSSLALQIPKSYEQPYGLQFESPGIEIDKLTAQDSLDIFLENDDVSPLLVYLNSKKSDVTIAPKSSVKIFTGTFKDVLLAGRSEYEDLTIKSSKDRKIHLTLKFVRLSGIDTLTVNVRAWRIHYGM